MAFYPRLDRVEDVGLPRVVRAEQHNNAGIERELDRLDCPKVLSRERLYSDSFLPLSLRDRRSRLSLVDIRTALGSVESAALGGKHFDVARKTLRSRSVTA